MLNLAVLDESMGDKQFGLDILHQMKPQQSTVIHPGFI
jgi:hypothetical protein